MQTTIKYHNLYQEFIGYSYEDLQRLFKDSKTKEEQDFYMTLANLVLRNKQKKIIESDANFTKTTPIEKSRILESQKMMQEGDVFSDSDINWD